MQNSYRNWFVSKSVVPKCGDVRIYPCSYRGTENEGAPTSTSLPVSVFLRSDSDNTLDTSEEISLCGMSDDGDLLDIFGNSISNVSRHINIFDSKLLSSNERYRSNYEQIKNILNENKSKIQFLLDISNEYINNFYYELIIKKITFKYQPRTRRLITEPRSLQQDIMDTNDIQLIQTLFKSFPSTVCRIDIYLKTNRQLFLFGQTRIKLKITSIENRQKVKYKYNI